MALPKRMSTDEIAGCANRMAEQLLRELQRHGVVVPAIKGPDDALRAADASSAPRDDRRIVALYRCLYWVRTVPPRDVNRRELRTRLGEQWTEFGLSVQDEQLADALFDILADFLRLKDAIEERRKVREEAAKGPPEPSVAARYKTALVALIELGQAFDSSFGYRPRTKSEWSRTQVSLESALHEGGFADAEIASIFGRSDPSEVARARSRRKKKS